MKAIKIREKESLDSEQIHYYSTDILISSKFNRIKISWDQYKKDVYLPITIKEKILGSFRIFRRLFRLDKCNILISNNNLVIIRGGWVYNYSLKSNKLKKTLKLKQCKNVLHQSIAQLPDGKLFFGEYGGNKNREAVNVYRSSDNGVSWEIIYTFSPGEIRHVHGCYYDPFSDKIWTLTGDDEGENRIMISNHDFSETETIGDGSQKFRAVNIFFEKDWVHWFMDSPLEKNYQYSLNRKTREVIKGESFPGPVWHLKRLDDGYYLVGTTVEKGKGVFQKSAGLYVSNDLKNWNCIKLFKKDLYPMPYFKWGVLGFADGRQTSKSFAIHFEALKKVDGKSYLYSIENE